MRTHPGVQAAACTVESSPAGHEILVGYFLGDGTELDPDTLRRHLAKLLPSYLQPQRVVRLAQLPLGPNGKLDTRSLADFAIDG